jgi:hypothetical protein
MLDYIICPNCGRNSGLSNPFMYSGPPLICRFCGKPLWTDTRIML